MNTFRASNYIGSKWLKKKVSYCGEVETVESCGYLSNCAEGWIKIKKYNNKISKCKQKLSLLPNKSLHRYYYIKSIFNIFFKYYVDETLSKFKRILFELFNLMY